MAKLLRWCNNGTVFCYAHAIFNVLPMQVLDLIRMFLGRVFSIFGKRLSKQFSTTVRILASCSTLPMQYHPFSSPSTPWRFRSTVKLPEDWDLFEYLLICCRAGYAFAIDPLKGPSRNYAQEFCEIRIFSHETAVFDALSAFAHPQASFFYSVAAFVVRLGLSWMSLIVTVTYHLLRSLCSIVFLSIEYIFLSIVLPEIGLPIADNRRISCRYHGNQLPRSLKLSKKRAY